MGDHDDGAQPGPRVVTRWWRRIFSAIAGQAIIEVYGVIFSGGRDSMREEAYPCLR